MPATYSCHDLRASQLQISVVTAQDDLYLEVLVACESRRAVQEALHTFIQRTIECESVPIKNQSGLMRKHILDKP